MRILLKGWKVETFVIAVLAQSEFHVTLGPQFMAIAEENSTHTAARGYIPICVHADLEHYTATLMASM